MRVGELAARAGVNVQTILFYERRRLLPRPPRTPGGYRSYTETDLAQVQFIRQTQQLGFTLREIAALIPIHGSPRHAGRLPLRSADDERALLRIVIDRLAQVDAQMAALQRVRDALQNAIDQSRPGLVVCPASGHAAHVMPDPSRSNGHRRKK